MKAYARAGNPIQPRGVYMPKGLFDNVPVVRDDRLKPYVDSVMGQISGKFGEMYNAVPDYTSAEISVKKQPGIYRLLVDKGQVVLKKVGRIFGSYNPDNNKIEIDPEVAEGKAPVSLRRVLGEEMIHYAQNRFGSIANYAKKFGKDARDYVEGAAATWADRMFGETGVYPREKRLFEDYEREVGPKAAFLGA